MEREGGAGAAWIAALPDLVDGLLQRWRCVPAGTAVSGKVAVVVPARSDMYGDVILKISFPHPANALEPDAYAAWRGHGAVKLWERDDDAFAMLLERIGPGMLADTDDIAEAVAIVGSLVRRLAVPAPPYLPRLRDQASHWASMAQRAAGRLPAHVVGTTVETTWDLCQEQSETMVHGDLHYHNVLRGVREPWQVIDPKCFVGDPAYDVITLLRPYAAQLRDTDDFESTMRRLVTVFADSRVGPGARAPMGTGARGRLSAAQLASRPGAMDPRRQ